MKEIFEQKFNDLLTLFPKDEIENIKKKCPEQGDKAYFFLLGYHAGKCLPKMSPDKLDMYATMILKSHDITSSDYRNMIKTGYQEV